MVLITSSDGHDYRGTYSPSYESIQMNEKERIPISHPTAAALERTKLTNTQ